MGSFNPRLESTKEEEGTTRNSSHTPTFRDSTVTWSKQMFHVCFETSALSTFVSVSSALRERSFKPKVTLVPG